MATLYHHALPLFRVWTLCCVAGRSCASSLLKSQTANTNLPFVARYRSPPPISPVTPPSPTLINTTAATDNKLLSESQCSDRRTGVPARILRLRPWEPVVKCTHSDRRSSTPPLPRLVMLFASLSFFVDILFCPRSLLYDAIRNEQGEVRVLRLRQPVVRLLRSSWPAALHRRVVGAAQVGRSSLYNNVISTTRRNTSEILCYVLRWWW